MVLLVGNTNRIINDLGSGLSCGVPLARFVLDKKRYPYSATAPHTHFGRTTRVCVRETPRKRRDASIGYCPPYKLREDNGGIGIAMYRLK